MRQLDFTGDMGSDRYSDDEDRYNYDKLEGLDGSGQGSDKSQRQGRPVGGGRDRGQNYNQQLGFMAEMGSDRYSDTEDDVMPAGARGSSGGGGSSSSSADFSGLLSEVADAMDFMDAGFDPVDSAFGGAGAGPMARKDAAGNASFMDEDTFAWGGDAGGDVSMAGSDEGSAAAQAVLQEWQSEGQQGTGNQPGFRAGQAGGKPYGAEPSTRSREGLGASFEFEAGAGLASADSLLSQLPPLEAELQKPAAQQQQQQQQQEPPVAAAAAKRKSRASTSSRRARKTEDAAAGEGTAAAGSRRKTSSRTAASRGTRKQQGAAAAAAAADVPLDGWVGGADAADEGFEEGWVDRMMDDGNDRVGLDDVMRS
jgi:hypothetical protein